MHSFWLRWSQPDLRRPFRVALPVAGFYAAINVLLVITPLIPPLVPTSSSVPYWVAPLIGAGVFLSGAGPSYRLTALKRQSTGPSLSSSSPGLATTISFRKRASSMMARPAPRCALTSRRRLTAAVRARVQIGLQTAGDRRVDM